MAGLDFGEEEVWAVMKGSEGSRDPLLLSSSSTPPKRLSGASRMMIPISNGFSDDGGGVQLQRSAPVNIPDWSKIYRSKASPALGGWHSGGSFGRGEEGDDSEEEGERVPPHEWIAKKLARSQISSSSVCEGIGRTLKGRDLRKMRNAVLTKTGFLE